MVATAGAGGGGGGSGFGSGSDFYGGGGGVGLFGQGNNGNIGNTDGNLGINQDGFINGGSGGSGGQAGGRWAAGNTPNQASRQSGGMYGGGAAISSRVGIGGSGGCRIIWGAGRSFPNNAE